MCRPDSASGSKVCKNSKAKKDQVITVITDWSGETGYFVKDTNQPHAQWQSAYETKKVSPNVGVTLGLD